MSFTMLVGGDPSVAIPSYIADGFVKQVYKG
jgi:hypothetical protein